MAGGMGSRVNRYLALWLIILVGLALRLRGLENPLLDNQAWRQADTASIGINMLGLLTRVPEVWVPHLFYDGAVPQKVELEFPFLPYLMAWTATVLGWSDLWGRLWAILFSLAALVGVYDLGRQLFSPRAGLFAAAGYAVTPLAIYYGRVVMPEPVAQTLSIWALSLAWRCRHKKKGVLILGAGLLFSGAVLAKLPQLMLLPVAVLFAFWPWRKGNARFLGIYLLASLIFPVLYYSWVHFQASGLGQFVSGIIANQVVDSAAYWEPLRKNLSQGLNKGLLVLVGIGGVMLLAVPREKEQVVRLAIVTWLLTSAAYLFFVCARIPLDYYLVPILPLVTLLAGYALDRLEGIPGAVLAVVIVSLVAYQSWAVLTPKYEWDPRILQQSLWLRSQLRMGQTLLLSDSPPMTFYYARAPGWRLHGGNEQELVKQIETVPAEFFVLLPGSMLPPDVEAKVRREYPEEAPGIFRLGRSSVER